MRRFHRPFLTGLLIIGAATGVATVLQGSGKSPSQQPGQKSQVHVEMRNVMYHFADDITVHIRRLDGELIPTKIGQIPIFDDKNSFGLGITAAEIAITPQSLANVLNRSVFTQKDAQLKDISIRIEKGHLKVKGKMPRKGNISFEADGYLDTTADGKIRLHSESIRALHVPVKGLMDLLGVEIADLIKTGKVPGIRAEKNDLILDPEQILPPPHIKGAVSSVHVDDDEITQVFGAPARYKWPRMQAKNYMAYRGNRLQFGKLTMNDVDLVLIDQDPSDPFDFYLDHYKEQLVAGYSKTTKDFGLRVFMVDFNKLKLPHPSTLPR